MKPRKKLNGVYWKESFEPSTIVHDFYEVETANYYKLDQVAIWYHFRFKKNKCLIRNLFQLKIKRFRKWLVYSGKKSKLLKAILRVIVVLLLHRVGNGFDLTLILLHSIRKITKGDEVIVPAILILLYSYSRSDLIPVWSSQSWKLNLNPI
jgi:hypothetical protein